MPGHIQDRWYTTKTGPDGKAVKVKTDRYGVGLRYRARYVGPDGTEKSQSFPDKQKRKAEAWLAEISADLRQGRYVDPSAGRMTLSQYAAQWLNSLSMDPSTYAGTEQRIRLHILPYLGARSLGALRPSHLRDWLRELERQNLAATYRRVIFANLSTLLTAAVEDRLIFQNPCRSTAVRAPRLDARRLVPWHRDRVHAVRGALPHHFRPMVDVAGGCGLRQGEIFGLAVDGVDALDSVVHVVRQVKLIGNRPVFAPPKGGKLRDVPLPDSVAAVLDDHITRHPPMSVTLPWKVLDGPPVTADLLFYGDDSRELNRNVFNRVIWRPALTAAGVPHARENGMHALRHFYASVLLDAGESIKALSEYLGHYDAGFTLRTYTHLMPSSEKRTKEAVDRVFGGPRGDDGPTTAPDGE
ncbi:site-specific integrase [Actinacidiphila glaucinigra]|uniref:tyrosine-type recombinase/integrase n=1 Tax=Actinacidiphila glaucinigra TaxID=235986 RepID=UPI00324FF07D